MLNKLKCAMTFHLNRITLGRPFSWTWVLPFD